MLLYRDFFIYHSSSNMLYICMQFSFYEKWMKQIYNYLNNS